MNLGLWTTTYSSNSNNYSCLLRIGPTAFDSPAFIVFPRWKEASGAMGSFILKKKNQIPNWSFNRRHSVINPDKGPGSA